MIPILKKAIFIVAFVLIALVLPSAILLLFIDSTAYFSIYVMTYAVIIFGILGYVVSTVKGTEKKINDALEELKMQNAAIAYKLSNSDVEQQKSENKTTNKAKEDATVKTENIPLNPAEPLVAPVVKKNTNAKADDGFDDFK